MNNTGNIFAEVVVTFEMWTKKPSRIHHGIQEAPVWDDTI